MVIYQLVKMLITGNLPGEDGDLPAGEDGDLPAGEDVD